MKKLIMLAILVLCPGSSFATVLFSDNFNDQTFSTSVVMVFNSLVQTGPSAMTWDSAHAHGGIGSCMTFDHSLTYNGSVWGGVVNINSMWNYYAGGIYMRHWIMYDTTYTFPAELGLFSNLKQLKVGYSSTYAIEAIWKGGSAGDGPTAMQVYWQPQVGAAGTGGTGTSSVGIGGTLLKGQWHKIEQYVRIGSSGGDSEIEIQVDDYTVIHENPADIKTPGTAYTGAYSMIGIRASQAAPTGHGTMYEDDFTIVAGEGNLCDNEPVEPSVVPRKVVGLSATGKMIDLGGGKQLEF